MRASETTWIVSSPAQNRAFVATAAGLMLVLGLACGGIGVAVDAPLSGGFSVDATDLVEEAQIWPVEATVYAWGDDGDHILVKRRERRKPDAVPEWWILVVDGHLAEGPFTDAEIVGARERLGVSPELRIDTCLERVAPHGDVDVHHALNVRLEWLREKQDWLDDRANDQQRSEEERSRWRSDLSGVKSSIEHCGAELARLGASFEER